MTKIKIIRSTRSSLSLQILPDASIEVKAPYLLPRFMIDRFLKEKEDWILKKQLIVKARLQTQEAHKDTYLYLGKRYQLETNMKQNSLIEVKDKIYLASSNKKYVKTYLTSWYKQQARKIIVERVHHYAKISGATFRTINITSAETRWGSCSSEKSLNFNWRLIMAPLAVIDYVVAHELAHLSEMNHSRSFWETVRKMYPLYREYRTWLKRNGNMLRV